MSEKLPTLEEWKKLYKLMDKIKNLSPWNWLEEDDVFAVEDPNTKEINFVSVTGAIGEHFAITLYRREAGFRKFWDFRENYSQKSDLAIQKLLEIPMLQASFEDRELLDKEEREIIKKLGLAYRGKNAWPSFRSFEPGFLPWFLNASEAQLLTTALEQTLEVTPLVEVNPDILFPDDKDGYLLRKPVRKENDLQWHDSIWHESLEPPAPIEFLPDDIAFKKVKSIPPKDISVEMDLFLSPQAVHERGERPYYPYILLIIDIKAGMIMNFEMIPPLPDLLSMWQKLPSIIAGMLLKISAVPAQIYVASEELYQSLVYLGNYMNLSVKHVKELKVVPEARKMFMNFMNK
jgi:hypothetical protein